MCSDSISKGECWKTDCRLRHVNATRRAPNQNSRKPSHRSNGNSKLQTGTTNSSESQTDFRSDRPPENRAAGGHRHQTGCGDIHSCPSPTSCTSATTATTAGAAATAAAASRGRNGPSNSTPEHTHSTHWNSTHDDGQSSLSGTSPGAALYGNDKPSVSSTTRAANQHDRRHDGDGSAEVDATDSRHGLLNHFSVFNCQGLLPRTVPSKVPYISDLLITVSCTL